MADENHSGLTPLSSQTRGRDPLAKSFWMTYLLIGTGTTTIIAVILVYWGDARDKDQVLVAGALLFSLVLIAWLFAFVAMTLLVVKDVIRWFRMRRVRSKEIIDNGPTDIRN